MTFAEFCRFYPEVAESLTFEQIVSCRFLESTGQRFCVDFGYGNAWDLAWKEIEFQCWNEPWIGIA